MSYTKKQLEERRIELLKQIDEIDKELSAIGETLKLKNKNLPFYKWSMAEWNQLFNINPTAYEWLSKHRESTIDDYNKSHYSTNKVVLEG